MVIAYSKMQLRLQIVMGKLEHYKETYHHLQFKINKQEISNMLKRRKIIGLKSVLSN